jgi:hypothetical protein
VRVSVRSCAGQLVLEQERVIRERALIACLKKPFKKTDDPIKDTPKKTGVPYFMEFPHGVGNFLGTKILPLEIFLNLIFQIIHPFGDIGNNRIDGSPPQGTGGLKAAAAGNQDIVIGQYDGADLPKPFHALR